MFCYQCEQTAKSVACTVKGVCGKEDEVAALQDLLVYALKGLSLVAAEAEPEGIVPSDTYPFLAEGIFVTLTNVNFDPEAIAGWIFGDRPFTAKPNPDYPGYTDYDQLMRLDEWMGRE